MSFVIQNTFEDQRANAAKIRFVDVQNQLDFYIADNNRLQYQSGAQRFEPASPQAALTGAGINTSAAFNIDTLADIPTGNTPGAWSNIVQNFTQKDNNIVRCSFVNGLLTLPAGKYQLMMQGVMNITGTNVIGMVCLLFFNNLTAAMQFQSIYTRAESDYENIAPIVLLDAFVLPVTTTLQLQGYSDYLLNFGGNTMAGAPVRACSLVVIKLL